MTHHCHDVGAFVPGGPTSARVLVRHADLLAAYTDGEIADDREGYLSHFAFGPEMRSHVAANRGSVAGFAGPTWCRWLVLDIDRADLTDALDDARKLVSFLHDRYAESEDAVPVYFSGGKGFHVLVELAQCPRPAIGFHAVARTFAEALANQAGVAIDTGIYDGNHIVRLPNTRHPRTGLFKRRIDAGDLFRLDIDRVRDHARHPAGDGLPSVPSCPANLPGDWNAAELATARAAADRAVRRESHSPDGRAPRCVLDLIRFGVPEGERHATLFRAAAWLAEQGSPPALVAALLTGPGRDIGLSPANVARQIQCGIDRARRQRDLPEGGSA